MVGIKRYCEAVVLLVFVFIAKSLFASTTLFVYRDLVLVESEVTDEKLLIPKNAYSLEIYPRGVTITEDVETNYCLDKDLFSKYISLSNEISVISNKISQTLDELSIHSNKFAILMEIAKSAQSSKDITSALSNSELIQKEIILRKSRLESLQKELEMKLREVDRIGVKVEALTFHYREIILSSKPEKVSYKIKGQWMLKYTINANENEASVKVKILLPSGTSIKANEVFITTSSYVSEVVDTKLPRLYAYLEEHKEIKGKGYVPMAIPKNFQNLSYEQMMKGKPEESPKFEEVSSSYDVTWNVKGNFLITNQYELSLDKINLNVSRKYFAIPSRYKNGFLVLEISNVSPFTLLPGEIELNLDKKISKGLYLSGSLPQNGVFTSDGMSVGELVVRKEVLQDKVENPGILGGNVKNIKSLKDVVRNSTSQEVIIQVLERIPIPSDNRININVISITPKPNEEIGVIKTNSVFSWTVKLKPGEEKELFYSYSIEYPKGLIYYETESEW